MAKPRIKCGVAGVGSLGQHHARIYASLPNVEFVGIFETSDARAAEICAKHNCRRFATIEELGEACDAVSVVVPTDRHAEVALPLLAQGCHLLIEKPICSSLEDAERVLAAARKAGVIVSVGHIEHFNPVMSYLEKHTGRPQYITTERLAPYTPRGTEVGVVLDLMIHDLDILLTLVGSEVESIEALGAHLLSEHEDIANVRVRFKTGCVADLTASRISMAKSRKLRAFQKDSYISLDYGAGALKVYRKKTPVIKSLKDVEILAPKLTTTDPLRNEHLHFLDCVRHNRKPWPSGERGVEALKLALQIAEELERYELSGHAGSRSLVPSWAQDLARVAKTVGKDILRS